MQIKPEWHIFFEATAHLINALLVIGYYTNPLEISIG